MFNWIHHQLPMTCLAIIMSLSVFETFILREEGSHNWSDWPTTLDYKSIEVVHTIFNYAEDVLVCSRKRKQWWGEKWITNYLSDVNTMTCKLLTLRFLWSVIKLLLGREGPEHLFVHSPAVCQYERMETAQITLKKVVLNIDSFKSSIILSTQVFVYQGWV